MASAMPQLIRHHLDANVGPTIVQALTQMQLQQIPSASIEFPPQLTTGMSPPRKMPRSNDVTTMDAVTPAKEIPPDETTTEKPNCS
jgi:hypothetical protein